MYLSIQVLVYGQNDTRSCGEVVVDFHMDYLIPGPAMPQRKNLWQKKVNLFYNCSIVFV